MNTQALKAAMALHGDTLADLSRTIGTTPGTASLKCTGKSEFTQNEIQAIVKRYNLTDEQVVNIFFCD